MASDAGDGHATLKRCLGVLRDARNDSEQFAALLLVRNGGIASGAGMEESKHPAGHGVPGGRGEVGMESSEQAASELWGSLKQNKAAWP